LAHDTVNEELYLLLMQTHLAQGNHAKALEVFAQADANIHQTYGIGPGIGLTRLARRIKDKYR
jgi:DNA-binding SARP family transcriptional activator